MGSKKVFASFAEPVLERSSLLESFPVKSPKLYGTLTRKHPASRTPLLC